MKKVFFVTEEERDKTIEEQDRISSAILMLADLMYADRDTPLAPEQKDFIKSQLRGLMDYYDVLDSRLLFF